MGPAEGPSDAVVRRTFEKFGSPYAHVEWVEPGKVRAKDAVMEANREERSVTVRVEEHPSREVKKQEVPSWWLRLARRITRSVQ